MADSRQKLIILTGGGTAGHVTPNLALIPGLTEQGYEVRYIGSKQGIERQLIEAEGITYYPISSGKVRRYFDLKNFTDIFRVIAGIFQARRVLRKARPDVIFSKGGFVAVPVVIAAKMLRIPCVCHESDYTPGLANKISAKFAPKVLTSFEATLKHLPQGKGVYVGSPVRRAVLDGNAAAGRQFLGFDGSKPILLVLGGSQGSQRLNKAVRDALPMLLETFDVVHGCGKGNLDAALDNQAGYRQYEYINKELPDVLHAANIAISRSGANSIFEYLSIGLPALLVPLEAGSRGDQVLNAEEFTAKGYSDMLRESDINEPADLYNAVMRLYSNRPKHIEAMHKFGSKDTIHAILDIINSCVKA